MLDSRKAEPSATTASIQCKSRFQIVSDDQDVGGKTGEEMNTFGQTSI